MLVALLVLVACSWRAGDALKNFAILQENACVGVSFNKVAGLQACNYIKKETLAQVFFCEIWFTIVRTSKNGHSWLSPLY